MTRRVVVLLVFTAFSGNELFGQIAFLTVREAEAVVERIPLVVAARRSGRCPSFTAGFASAEDLVIQVRSGCGSTAGMLLNNYTVNRRTGATSSWGDDPEPALDSEGQAFEKRLVAEARSRALTVHEATCIALEGAKSVPGWSGPEAVVTVQPLGQPGSGQMLFTALNRASHSAIQTSRTLTVDLNTPWVRDDESGIDLASARLGSLLAKLIELRAPPALTDEDALAVALSVPAVASRIQPGCLLTGGGALSSDEVFAGVSCGGELRGDLVSINLRTGRVANDRTREAYEPGAAASLARRFLDARESHRSELRKEIQAACGG